ncbi:MAG TPA: uroporphyrinogen decarboxylase [Anaerolineaceae bacterium]|nr:uroporphyrinogen decarboxylase [Anaerolineaceae bacterium]
MIEKTFTGKDLLFSVLRHEDSDAVPWVPFAGVHAGSLKGYNARQVLLDPGKLVESLLEVKKVYDPDGMPILFDLQVEAEILGCELLWADEAPPSVASHPLAATKAIPEYIPQTEDGRIPIILQVMHSIKKEVGDTTALYGLVTGPFTLASHLRGTDIFLDSVDDPDFVTALVEYTTQVAIAISKYYIDAGMDVIAVVDPLISQISPRMFKRFFTQPFREIFESIRKQGVFSAFFVCGDATKNIRAMCETNPDCIAVDENIDMVAAKAITDEFNITLGGNIPLTTCMLLGNQQDNMKYVVDLLDALDHHNLIISPGCDMPYAIPIENTIAAVQAVREPDNTRKVIENYTKAEINIPITLPNYASLTKPLIEVFTLDPDTCAACTYMWRAAQKIKEILGDSIDLALYKITEIETIARVKKMGIEKIPSIYINGELKYSSIIPGQSEFLEEVKKYQ